MSEQVLSQEEVDALLSAIDVGEVNLEKDKEERPDVVPYDLTSQNRILHDQFEALEKVYDRFVKSLRSSLSYSLGRTIEVSFVSTEKVKFCDFLKLFSNPTSFNIFNIKPLIGSAMIVIEPDLLFSLIDCMFGGKGKTVSQVREFTLIEQRAIKIFVIEVLKNFEKAWKIIHSVEVSLKDTENNPRFVRLVDPNDSAMVIVFSINGDEFSGKIYFCIPYLMLEPFKDKLSYGNLTNLETDNKWNAELQALLQETRVSITTELGMTTHTVSELLNLQQGDVVKLNTGPHDPVTVKVEGVPKFQGVPGVVKGNRAVEITALLRQNGGVNNHG